ncbi:hypothetical protein CHCC20375_1572 [Bacillus licheniformis]|nr:hypothetical protein CHCC20375_1572 [Bacillus licheniformis]
MKDSASHLKIPSIHPKRGNITHVLFTALSISPQKFQNVYKKTKQKTYRFRQAYEQRSLSFFM